MNKQVELIRKEIERRISVIDNRENKIPADKVALIQLQAVLSFIDSMQEEPVSEELEEASLLYYPKMSRISETHGIIPADNQSHYLGDANKDNRKAFKAGAEWGKNQAKVEIQAQSMALAHGCPKEYTTEDLEEAAELYMLNQDTYNSHVEYQIKGAFKAGANWQKKQRIKHNVESVVEGATYIILEDTGKMFQKGDYFIGRSDNMLEHCRSGVKIEYTLKWRDLITIIKED